MRNQLLCGAGALAREISCSGHISVRESSSSRRITMVHALLSSLRSLSLRPLRLKALLSDLCGCSQRSLRLKVFRVLALISPFVLSTLPAPAQQKSILLKGGKLLTISHGVVDNGAILI